MIQKVITLKNKMIGKIERLKLLRFSIFGISILLLMTLFKGNSICLADPLQKPWRQSNLEEYEVGITSLDSFSGSLSAYIKSKNVKIKRNGNIEQSFDIPANWLGRRIELTTYLKAINVETTAGLYILIVNDIGESNYDSVKIKKEGNGWAKYAVALNIPHNAISIKFGAWLLGLGEIRVDNFAFQVVDHSVEAENKTPEISYGSVHNLNFEQKSKNNSFTMPWMQNNFEEYETGIIVSDSYSGHRSAYIKSKNTKSSVTYCCFTQSVNVPKQSKQWLGKKIQLTAYLKSLNVETAAGLFVKVGYENGDYSQDQMRDRPVKGNTDWTQYTSIFDVPYDSVFVHFGACLKGKGEVRVDDFNFQVVNDTVETTGKYYKRKYGYPQNLDFEQEFM